MSQSKFAVQQTINELLGRRASLKMFFGNFTGVDESSGFALNVLEATSCVGLVSISQP